MVETEKLRSLRRTILFQDENNPKLMRLFGSLFVAAPQQAEKIEAAIRSYLDFNYPPETAEILWEAVAQYREAGTAFDAALQALKGVWDKRASIFLAIKVCEMLRPADQTLNVFLRRVAINLDLSSQDAAVVRLVAGAATDSSTIQTSSAAQKFKVGPKSSPETFLVPQLGDAVDVVYYLGDFFVASADEGAQLNGKPLPPKFAVRFGLLDELRSGSFYLLYRDLQFLQRWFRSGRFQRRQFQLKQESRPTLEEVSGQASGAVLSLQPTTLTVRGDTQTTQLNWQDSIAIEGKTLAVEDLVPLMLADMSAPLASESGGTETPRCVLEVENMSCLFGKKPGLTDVTFSAAGGQMIAVMGPSGCGKSTLLGTITGTIPIVRGQIRLNGENLGPLVKADPRRLGFVPQDDVLFDTLTVAENLRFGAQLRVAASQADNLDPIVDHVLDEIDLKERAHVLVGNVTKKTLSGGQRKRLNIGLEFLTPKPVLLLDEPTSGLSSADAERILQILRLRADAGTLVIVVIHQPSATLFRLFDRLLLLDKGGLTAYFGDPRQAGEYIAAAAPLPSSLDLRELDPEMILGALEVPVRQFDGRSEDRREFEPAYWKARYEFYRQKNPDPAVRNTLPPSGRKLGTGKSQGAALLTRSLIAKLRDSSSLMALFGTACLLAVVTGWFLRNTSSNLPYTLSNNHLFQAFPFLSVIIALFLGMSSSITEVLRERAILKREKLLKVNLTFWLFSKYLTLFLATALPIAAYVLITFLLLQIREVYFLYFVFLWLVSAVGIGIGLAISSIPNISSAGATTFLPLVLVPQLVLAGSSFFDFDKMQHLVIIPAGVNSVTQETIKKVPEIADLMPSRWAYEGLLALHLNHSQWRKVEDLNNLKDRLGDERKALANKNTKDLVVDSVTSLVDFFRQLSDPNTGDIATFFFPYKTELIDLVLNNPNGKDDPSHSSLLMRYKVWPFPATWINTEYFNGLVLIIFSVVCFVVARVLLAWSLR